MSHQAESAVSAPISLTIGKAIFGRTLVGWSMNNTGIAVQFGRDEIRFVMPGGRPIRIDLRQLLKPISDLVINSDDEPYFLAIRPNANVAGLKSFNSRIPCGDRVHDTRYITLFVENDIDDVVSSISELGENYRLVMRHIDRSQIPHYDPFHERLLRRRSDPDQTQSSPPPTRKRRHRRLPSDSESSSSGGQVDKSWRKSEQLRTKRRFTARAPKENSASSSRSLSRLSARRRETKRDSDSDEDRAKSSSRTASPDERPKARRKRFGRGADIVMPERDSHRSDRRVNSYEKKPRRSRSRKGSLTPRETEGDVESKQNRSRRSQSKLATPAKRGLRWRLSRDRRESRSHMSDTESPPSRKPPTKSSSRHSLQSPAGSGVKRSRPPSRTGSANPADSDSAKRCPSSLRGDGPRSRPEPAVVQRRRITSQRTRSTMSASPKRADDSQENDALESTSIDRGLESSAGSASDTAGGDVQAASASNCSSATAVDVQRVESWKRLQSKAPNRGGMGSDQDASLSEPNTGDSSPSHTGSVHRLAASPPSFKAAACADTSSSSAHSSASPDVRSPAASGIPKQDSPTLPSSSDACTPSSGDDSGAARSITDPLSGSSADVNQAASPSRIIRPGMTVYWCEPGRIVRHGKRQCGKVFSHKKRIRTQTCLKLDSGDVLTLNSIVKVNARSASPARRLSEFTLVSG